MAVQDRLVYRGFQELKVNLDLRATREPLVLQEPRDSQEHQAQWVHPDHQGPLGLKVYPEHKESLDCPVYLGLLVHLEQMVSREFLVRKVIWDLWASLVSLGIRDREGQRVIKGREV